MPEVIIQRIKKGYYLRKLKRQSELDELEFSLIKALVGDRETVVDVGANFGSFTYFLSRLVGENGVVHGIEPIPLTYEILSNSIRKMRLKNVQLWNFAASDHQGTATMEIPKYEGGQTENFYQARIVSEGQRVAALRHYRIDLRTLDSLPNVLQERLSFVKIDVEGHELEVIKGATRLISVSKPSLLIEISGDLEDQTSGAAQLSRCLEREGYRPYWLDEGRLRMWKKGVRRVNYFYLTEEHLRKVEGFLFETKKTA